MGGLGRMNQFFQPLRNQPLGKVEPKQPLGKVEPKQPLGKVEPNRMKILLTTLVQPFSKVDSKG